MQRIFAIEKGIRVPDGTLVYPFLNPKDCGSNLPVDLLDDFSLAMGEIGARQHSKIHVMPLVTQVTFVLHGLLEVWMKDSDHPQPYSLRLDKEQAVLTRPGTFLQFRNQTDSPCRVLYIVNPAYLFLLDEEGRVIYDDSVVLDEDWAGLEGVRWKPEKLHVSGLTVEARQRAADLLAKRGKG